MLLPLLPVMLLLLLLGVAGFMGRVGSCVQCRDAVGFVDVVDRGAVEIGTLLHGVNLRPVRIRLDNIGMPDECGTTFVGAGIVRCLAIARDTRHNGWFFGAILQYRN